MVLVRFGVWDSHHGRVFSWERFYGKAGKWTPLCRVSFRYLKTFEERISEITEVADPPATP